MSDSTLIRNRNFMLLWTGNITSLFGTSSARIAYPLIVLAVTGSPVLAGWVTFTATLPGLVFRLPAGIVADYWNRRRSMLVCQLAGGLAAALATVGVYLEWPMLVSLLMATAFLEGMFFAFFSLAEIGAVRDVVHEDQRAAAFAFYEAQQPSALLVGRALGATLFGLSGWLPFAANTATYACAVGTLAAVPSHLLAPRPPDLDEKAASVGSRLAAGFRWAWSLPFLRDATLVTAVTNMIFEVVILLVIVSGTERGYPPWVAGVILSATGVGGIIGSFVASRLARRYRPQVLFSAGVGVWAVLLVPVALTTNPYGVAVAWCGVGAIGTVINVAGTIYQVENVPDAVFGRVIGATSLISIGAVPVGSLIAGYLIGGWGIQAAGWTILGVMVVLALLCARLARSSWSQQTTPSPAVLETTDRS